MVVDPYHGYSSEAERANYDICDGFKVKNPSVFMAYNIQK